MEIQYKEESSSHVVCVVGMHRSGMAVASRLVNLLGVYLGPESHLLKPGVDSPKGSWQHERFTELNEAIFKVFGGNHLNPPNLVDGWEKSPQVVDLMARARAIIEEDFRTATLWGWKDPLNSFTLPFWRQFLPAMKYVICLRNPLDVARSLEIQSGLSIEQSAKLWVAYVRSALMLTAGYSRILIFYEDVMNDWQKEFYRLSVFLDKPELAKQRKIRNVARDFLDAGLRHHFTSVPDTLRAAELPSLAKSIYALLRLNVGLSKEELPDRDSPSVAKSHISGPGQKTEITFVSHDAGRGGAQRALLTFADWLQQTSNIQPKFIIRGENGELIEDFHRLGPVLEVQPLRQKGVETVRTEILKFSTNSALVYINTLVPGDIAEILSALPIPIITHVHEMEHAINKWCAPDQLGTLLRLSDHFIAVSPAVARNLESNHGVDPRRISTIYELISSTSPKLSSVEKHSRRNDKGLPETGFVVFGCGTTDWRKGPEIFIDVAQHLIKGKDINDVYFYWLGADVFPSQLRWLEGKIRDLHLENRVRFLGEIADPKSYFIAGDVFLLTSREDPFPLVGLEAADCGLPIICFEGSGGMPIFVRNDAGYVVPYEQSKTMADRVFELYANAEERNRLGTTALERVRSVHDVSVVGAQILELINGYLDGSLSDSIRRHLESEQISSEINCPERNESEILFNYLQQLLAEGEDRFSWLSEQSGRLVQQVSQLETQLGEDQQTLADRETRIREYETQRDPLIRRTEDLEKQLREDRQTLADRETRLREYEAQRDLVVQRNIELQSAIDSDQRALRAQAREIGQYQLRQEQLTQQVQEIQSSSQSQKHALSADVERESARGRELEQLHKMATMQLERQANELVDRASDVTRLEGELKALLSSRSYRMMAPLRLTKTTIELLRRPSKGSFSRAESRVAKLISGDQPRNKCADIAFFTICSKNYLAYAKALFRSLRKFYPDVPFYVALCDRLDGSLDPLQEPFPIIEVSEIGIPNWEAMAERYNITEFNTAIKPFVFLHLFKQYKHDAVVYMDPDVLIMSRLVEVESAFLNGADVILTPHILEPAENVEVSDVKMLQFGICNLGFIGLRNSAQVRNIVSWWGRRLERDCVIKLEEGIFVDQKWADLFPAFINQTQFLRHPGYNVGYWNLAQRKVERRGDEWLVNGEALRFVHFSGNQLDNPYIFSRHSGQITLENIGDLRILLDEYRRLVFEQGHDRYRHLPYAFSWNGASGVNLHTPKPAYQDDRMQVITQTAALPGATLTTGITESGYAAYTLAKVPTLAIANQMREPSWGSVVLSARKRFGGWMPMMKRAEKIVRAGGLRALKQRVAFAHARARVEQFLPRLPDSITIGNGNGVAQEEAAAVPMGLATTSIPRIFVTDWSTPRPDQDAGSVTTFFVLKIMVELGYDVTFIPSDLEYLGEYTERVRRLGVKCLHKQDIDSISNHLKQRGGDYSAYFLFRAPIAALYLADIRRYSPHAKMILETVDLHYLREERSATADGAEQAIAKARNTKNWELKIIAACDVSIVLSSVEQELLTRELPSSDIRTLPLLFLDMSGPSGHSFEQRKDIVFIGSFRHLPNVDAVVYFCQEIWPLVHQHLPEAQFLIIGSDPTAEVLALSTLPNVRVLGHVKNIDPIFGSARLSVVPLRYGSGIKGKISTSLGYGVPVVGTPIAVEGMELRDGEHVMVRADVSAFASAVVRVYSDPELWNHLSTEGFEHVYSVYSESAGRMRMKGLMDSLRLKSTDFEFHRFKSHYEYQRYKRDRAAENQRRAQIEMELIHHDSECFYVDGFCAVCDTQTHFQVGFMYSYQQIADGKPIPNWREHLNCIKCGFTNRIRSSLHLLQILVRPQQDSRIYVTEQSTPLYKWLRSRYPQVTGSEYLADDLPPGAYRGGLRNENLTRLSFPDESFDLILSLDVMEHVTDDVAAFTECYRCLAPGGTLVFTAPCDLNSRSNTVRARIKPDGTIEHLMLPPEYHGNPVDPEHGALCFRYFGWEVIDQLKSAGFEDAHALVFWSRDLGYLGGEQVLFVATKDHGQASA